jgi:hypothetical protein
LREGLPRREQEQYINALQNELAMTNNQVIPQKGFFDINVSDHAYERPPIDLPDIYAQGGGVHMSGGGAMKKLLGGLEQIAKLPDEEVARQAIAKASQSAGMNAPVTANKNLNTLQDFHTSFMDAIGERAGNMQDLIESMPHKYDVGQRVFTHSSQAKNLPPYTILYKYPFGNNPVKADHPTLGKGMGKSVKDPVTGKTLRTPYEAGYKVRSENGEDWSEFHIPESAIKGSVEESKGGPIHMDKGGALMKLMPLFEREANKAKFLEPSAIKDRVYHGTGADIEEFKPSVIGAMGPGTYVTLNPKEASSYANVKNYNRDQNLPNVLPLHVQVKKPFPIKNVNRSASEFFLHFDPSGKMSDEEVIELAKNAGYDAVHALEEGHMNIFDPRKIKSAIGNEGTYDITNPHINKAKGGGVHPHHAYFQVLKKAAHQGKIKIPHMDKGGAIKLAKDLVAGVHYHDPLVAPTMRMSEALGNAGAEGKMLNFTEADRSRVHGKNMGGVGFSGIQLYSQPHFDANTAWGFGNKTTAEKKIAQNDPENSIWTTWIGSPNQHKSNSVVLGDAFKTFQDSIKSGKATPHQIKLKNQKLNELVDKDTGKKIFEEGFDIADPEAFDKANSFAKRGAIGDVFLGLGSKGPMRLKNSPEKWQDVANMEGILQRETDPNLLGAGTYDVGNGLFMLDNGVIHQPKLNEAFPYQVTGSDTGLRYQLVPQEIAMRDWSKQYEGRLNKSGKPAPIGYMDLARNNPKQFVSDEYLKYLQQQGYKGGGFISKLKQHIEHHQSGGFMSKFKQHFDEGGYVDAMGNVVAGSEPAPQADAKHVGNVASKVTKNLREELAKEYKTLQTPEGRKDVALRVGSGIVGGAPDLANMAMSFVPALNKKESVFGGDTVPAYPLHGSENINEALKTAGALGENEAPIAELAGMIFGPSGLSKVAKLTKGLPVGASIKMQGMSPRDIAMAKYKADRPSMVAKVLADEQLNKDYDMFVKGMPLNSRPSLEEYKKITNRRQGGLTLVR